MSKIDMKKILLIIMLLGFSFSCALTLKTLDKNKTYKTSEEFVQGSEDIPLLTNMKQATDDDIGFDSNSGSIINSSYETQVGFSEIKDFYANTLPAMGWKMIKSDDKNKIEFVRDKEKLEINFKEQKNNNLVSFFIVS